MSLFGVDNWLKTPADRDIIARWTVGGSERRTHALALPAPPDRDQFEFLILGDTGDSEASGPRLSPQDAVAEHLAADAALPGSEGRARLVLHTGDVVYPRGALCRYDDRFFAPYADLLVTTPFYPNLGNHDLEAAGGAAYFDVFRLPAATPTGGERFYAFDSGPVRIVVLDGEVVQPSGDPALAALQTEWP